MSPFEIVYGFRHLALLDMIVLPLKDVVSVGREEKPEAMKKLHAKV